MIKRKIPMKKNKLSIEQKFDLFYQIYSLHDYWPRDSVFKDEDHRCRTWAAYRDQLIEEWKSNKAPGTRPAGFWDYDAPSKLQVKALIPMEKVQTCYHTGRSITHREIWESERDALQRMNLLEPWEKGLN